MNATAAGITQRPPVRFFDSVLGKKVVMAVSGVILFAFVVGHLAGNLQIFEGPEKINAYARFLRSMPTLLWGTRIVLLVMVILHIWAAVQLGVRKTKARPIAYTKKESIVSSYASRTMYWSGPIILAFVIYHLLDLTFGVVHPGFQEGNIYANMVGSFRIIPVSVFYIVAIALLGLHLYHGLWSMFQTLGLNHPRYTRWYKRFAQVFSIVIVMGFISIPIAVMTGVVR